MAEISDYISENLVKAFLLGFFASLLASIIGTAIMSPREQTK